MIKKEFKEIFNRDGSSKHYVQHNTYKNITIPLDVFNDMTEEEVENYISQTLFDINKNINQLNKPKKQQNNLSADEIKNTFAELKRKLQENFSFENYIKFKKIIELYQ